MGVLETTYNTAMEKPLRILEIFNDFFGEDRVDMQGFPTYSEVASALPERSSLTAVKNWINNACSVGFILVHFPHVTIKNEHDRSTDINHLYAKVSFKLDGTMYGRFMLNRSDYTMLHMMNDYMHSHISSIPFGNFTVFQSPCTGSGPINNTICSLSRDFDENLWRLFCLELSKYVEVESIAGTPYHRLEGLTRGGGGNSYRICERLSPREIYDCPSTNGSKLNKITLANFTKYLIDKEILRFRFVGNEYRLAMSATECAIKVSNCFIEWYNREFRAQRQTARVAELLGSGELMSCKFSNGGLMVSCNRRGGNPEQYYVYIGQPVCTFKGQPVTITISDVQINQSREENEVLILKPEIIEYILTKIIFVINFRYGNERNHEEGSPDKKVYFL